MSVNWSDRMRAMHGGSLEARFASLPRSQPPNDVDAVEQVAKAIDAPDDNFRFRQRRGQLNLRRIAALDIDKLVRTVDVDALQSNLHNLCFADLKAGNLHLYSDEHFVKLFRVAQLTVEVLLHEQGRKADYSRLLEGECRALQSEAADLQSSAEAHNLELAQLKAAVRRKRRTIATYEVLLTQGKAKASRPKRYRVKSNASGGNTTASAAAKCVSRLCRVFERVREALPTGDANHGDDTVPRKQLARALQRNAI